MAKTAKVFMTGRSQAVRLPKEFRFEGSEVEIVRDPVSGCGLRTVARQFESDRDGAVRLGHVDCRSRDFI